VLFVRISISELCVYTKYSSEANESFPLCAFPHECEANKAHKRRIELSKEIAGKQRLKTSFKADPEEAPAPAPGSQ